MQDRLFIAYIWIEASLLQICADNVNSNSFHTFGTKVIPAVFDVVTGLFKNPQCICQLVLNKGKQLLSSIFLCANDSILHGVHAIFQSASPIGQLRCAISKGRSAGRQRGCASGQGGSPCVQLRQASMKL